ncbi:3-hydroxyacyl-CoA dehydrogenase NAD-binding domain-containing protein [Rhizobium alvei]|uniref:3-hydroxyacyl-CoA dehydrogenase NAD-binding domain-containing protein n=1 Tax=Rhizobium alvei TaxID=1132659 RepID=A0ABT8YMZ1_9HYPH|nr:3-hydroxyacyl-CoA dehydrogenase NAD-binding domain-containing protein [Rhizobium alvei]MDO6965067.1 3-hydroxyacyl-CoA dehydrogenase NAD-binding domain-containing protein [Rhizobium alvei]
MSMNFPQPVALSYSGTVAIVTLSNPPVNAISKAVREGLIAAFAQIRSEATASAVVLWGGEGRFVAGADIRELEFAPEPPFLPEVVRVIDAMDIPVVAAIDGPALGGGLEIALACDLRLAGPKALAGLPETNLGIVPGAGGTQRLPRLTGVPEAIRLIGSATILKAKEAVTAEIFDAVIAENLLEAAIGRAQGCPKRRLSEMPAPPATEAEIEAATSAVRKKARGVPAILEVPAIVAASLTLSFDDALAMERESSVRLRLTDEAAALRHLFLAERGAGRMPDGMTGNSRTATNVAIIGGGTMGAGIAMAFVSSGLPVTIIERDQTAIEAAGARIDGLFDRQAESGRLREADRAERRASVTITDDWQSLAQTDLIIEAAFEDLDVKTEIFRKLDAIARPGALLATNTSYLDIDAIAQATKRPEDVIGLHFFSPAHVMKLLEVVRGSHTSADAIATGLAIGRKIGKLPILAGNCDGFIGNRIYAVYRRHAEYLVEDGATPDQIDRALEAFGFAKGVFAVSDMSGLDIGYAMRKRRAATRDPAERYSVLGDRIVEMGRLGRKTGAGWYAYGAAGKREDDPAIADLIDRVRAERAITPRPFTDEEIQLRLLAVMVNEACRILDEGIAGRAADIDLVFVNGYGFPRLKGGPMHAAGKIGWDRILKNVIDAQPAGGPSSVPSPRLVEAAASGRSLL